ncbi:BLOC-1-related complex subunit 6-like [Corticium candelabrum]|uniref:BLOC-1-related complex subunit 6-like n=1 Tax=Corticium candelabrum TaxID=121492 RepID=UPI002E267CDB|nr:BLOC-1-related complex subunit 6-like [Corticium candelabrum]
MTDTRTVQKSDEDKDTQKEYVDLMHSSSSQDGENECALIDESGEDLNIEEKKSIEDGSEDLDQNIFLDDDEPIEVYGEGLPHNIETDIPLLDQDVLYDLEQHAKRVADSLGLMTGHLTNALHYMSAITMHCMDSYQQAATELGQTVDVSIKTMYALIAKCEAIANSMEPVEQLAQQVYDIKRTLERLERLCK